MPAIASRNGIGTHGVRASERCGIPKSKNQRYHTQIYFGISFAADPCFRYGNELSLVRVSGEDAKLSDCARRSAKRQSPRMMAPEKYARAPMAERREVACLQTFGDPGHGEVLEGLGPVARRK